jgi:signal peptide peptidase SppA
VAELARQKPTTAIVNTLAASGGYWLAAGAREIVAAPSSHAGAVGIIMVHDDISKLQEKLGITSTVLSAGQHKGEGSPYQPLSAADRAALRRRLDVFYDLFTRAVAVGRHTTPDAVRNGYGQGRTLVARDALAAGLVDRIETPRAALVRIAAGATRGEFSASVIDADHDARRRRLRLAEIRLQIASPCTPTTSAVDGDLERRRRRHRFAEATRR